MNEIDIVKSKTKRRYLHTDLLREIVGFLDITTDVFLTALQSHWERISEYTETRSLVTKTKFSSGGERIERRIQGRLQSIRDRPAIECPTGKAWFQQGRLHRDGDKPAIKYADGNREWRIQGMLHRKDDLPALVTETCKKWFWNGQLHREGGKPAVEWEEGSKEWYEHGESYRDDELKISQEKFLVRLMWWRYAYDTHFTQVMCG